MRASWLANDKKPHPFCAVGDSIYTKQFRCGVSHCDSPIPMHKRTELNVRWYVTAHIDDHARGNHHARVHMCLYTPLKYKVILQYLVSLALHARNSLRLCLTWHVRCVALLSQSTERLVDALSVRPARQRVGVVWCGVVCRMA